MAEKENIQIFDVNLEAVQQPYTYDAELNVELPQNVEASMQLEVPEINVIVISQEEPLITPIEFRNIGSSSIDASFNVSTVNATEVVKGLIYSDNEHPDFNDSYKLDYGRGTFDLTITGLRNNTTYYFKPYALSNLGYKYGNVQSCQTAYSPIPDEYQLVEYLESDGNGQYIDLNYIPSIYSRIICDMAVTSFSGRNSSGIVYTDNLGWLEFGYVPNLSPNELTVRWSTSSSVTGGRIPYDTNFHTYDIANDEQKIDDVVVATVHLNSFPGTLPVRLFYLDVNYVPVPSVSTFKQKISKCRIYTAGQEVYNMYSVRRKADNKPGFYDLATGTLFTNAGTGEFIIGPDKEWDE